MARTLSRIRHRAVRRHLRTLSRRALGRLVRRLLSRIEATLGRGLRWGELLALIPSLPQCPGFLSSVLTDDPLFQPVESNSD